jgi:hypothetical protein
MFSLFHQSPPQPSPGESSDNPRAQAAVNDSRMLVVHRWTGVQDTLLDEPARSVRGATPDASVELTLDDR